MSDKTEIVVLLDRSGSMQSAKNDHEGGLRSFVEDQKQLVGDVRFTLIQFDTDEPCGIVYDGVPIEKVDKIELIPRGGTPLLDAIGLATAHVEKRLAGQSPDQIIVMVITDGEENSSREFTKDQIKSRITDLEKKQWKFLYLGANVDAFSEAQGMGMRSSVAMDFANTPIGTNALYRATSSNVTRGRCLAASLKAKGKELDQEVLTSALSYTDEQRAAASGEPQSMLAKPKE